MSKLLIVEDDKTLANSIEEWFVGEHYAVDKVSDGDQALYQLQFYSYDVVILDWMLPDTSGVEVLKRFRAGGGTTPVLILTGKDHVLDKEKGLDSGADDYLTKPFQLRELSARIRALLRRSPQLTPTTLSFRHIVLDPSNHRVTKAGRNIHLPPIEFSLLEFFIKHANQVFSADALLERIWPSTSDVSPDAVRTYIARLRAKIDSDGEPSIIQNVHGVGYKLGEP